MGKKGNPGAGALRPGVCRGRILGKPQKKPSELGGNAGYSTTILVGKRGGKTETVGRSGRESRSLKGELFY